MSDDLPLRFDRSIRLFGADGQRKLATTDVAVAGVGGLGSPVAQHLALLGVRHIALIDDDDIDETSRNRFIGARHDDPVPGSPKPLLAARLVQEINPAVGVNPITKGLVSEEAFDAIKGADVVFGCFDEDGPRAILNELSAAYGKLYFDLASDVPEPGVWGGRVCTCDGGGCLWCMGEIDPAAVEAFLRTDAEREIRRRIYGIDADALGEKGPSVSPINGVVAGLGAVEFMAAVTGLRPAQRFLTYRGHQGKVTVRSDPRPDCPICKGVWNKRERADVERYLRMPHLRSRRRSAT